MNCPYDFITDFAKWWHWHVLIECEHLTPEQATQDCHFVFGGWKRVDAKHTGMWTPDRASRKYWEPW